MRPKQAQVKMTGVPGYGEGFTPPAPRRNENLTRLDGEFAGDVRYLQNGFNRLNQNKTG